MKENDSENKQLMLTRGRRFIIFFSLMVVILLMYFVLANIISEKKIYDIKSTEKMEETGTTLDEILLNGLACYSAEKKIYVYYYDNSFYFICRNDWDFDSRFNLHTYAVKNEELPSDRQQYGYCSLDFLFYEKEITIEGLNNYRVACVNVPNNHQIDKIDIGQYNKSLGYSWKKNLRLANIIQY